MCILLFIIINIYINLAQWIGRVSPHVANTGQATVEAKKIKLGSNSLHRMNRKFFPVLAAAIRIQ